MIDTLEHELRLASRRRVRLAAARLPRPPSGAVAFAVVLVVCAAVAVPLLATRVGTTAGHPSTLGGGEPPPQRAPIEHKVLSGNGIGRVSFGQGPHTAIRRIDALLGRRPTRPYSTASACRIDHAAAWPGLEIYFEHGRFVGYAYSLRYQQARTGTTILATRRGLRVGDSVATGKRLYGSAFRTSTAQGGSWLVNTRQGRIDGYASTPTGSHGWIASIEAGYVGCPAMTP